MKTVRFYETGGPEVLRYEDAERPDPGEGEVRIVVAGSAFSPADAAIRAGFLPLPIALPHTPGYDVSGTIDAIGQGVHDLTVGERVIGFLPMAADGSASQYVIAPADVLVTAPTAIPLADSAGVPSVALTAWQALYEAGELQSGQRVLINGAGGAVGGYAVQLAKRAGAYVIATASPQSRQVVSAAGADEIIDHTTSTVPDAVGEPVDLLLNLALVSPDEFTALVTRVRDGGKVVSTTAALPTPGDEQRDVSATTLFVRPDTGLLSRIVALIDSGELHVEIARHAPLSDLPSIHQQAAAGQVHGKIVIVPPAA
ncbi:NADP-dependent oxidoreductase [Microbacterium terrisoli]|jgi:NADPH:quinone reductase-like Zn-dependent oxidoreductase|uniref:NADP-dependent oxidoreductase n=1 Tax=Microbacterium terrisoli TaxID=3242192 RepID=UPI002804D421|nr:NADP-dependent oxidoreductase [Microbacterium protaetiae]